MECSGKLIRLQDIQLQNIGMEETTLEMGIQTTPSMMKYVLRHMPYAIEYARL